MSLVSIIIPYSNKKKFLKKTLNSVFTQTYKNFEVLFIYDDPDKSDYQLFKKYLSKPKVKVFYNKKNLGAGLSRNKGLKYAKGKYIAFLDSDDLWKRNKLKKQLKFMTENKISVSHTSYEIIDKFGKKIGQRNAKEYLDYSNLLPSCDIGLSTVIIEKKILKNFKFPSTKTKEDYILWLNLTKKKYNFYGYQNSLTKWRKLDDSLSSSTYQKLVDGFKVYNKYLKLNIFISFIYLIRLSINFLLKD
jgi:teichuronic acid biosynthesis glycosyltransferase TuaG